jgi:hypothetical protein
MIRHSMYGEVNKILKEYNTRLNRLDDHLDEFKRQYDRAQYELMDVKRILLEVCKNVAPEKVENIRRMLTTHDKKFKTIYNENGESPLATIRFSHQLYKDLDRIYSSVWNNI